MTPDQTTEGQTTLKKKKKTHADIGTRAQALRAGRSAMGARAR